MTDLLIHGGTVLLPGGFARSDVLVAAGLLHLDRTRDRPAGAVLDATGLLVLPGIIDSHGDAFERQIQPRPGVAFPPALAVAETEAQLLANGITTAYHGVTLSWEPGLRGREMWRAWLDALDAHRPRAACDMRVHLRWEAFNLDALNLAEADIAAGRVHVLAFNDHTPSIVRRLDDPAAAAKFSERAMLSADAFRTVAERAWSAKDGVAAGLDRIGAAARRAALPMASHDDRTVEERDAFRARGARICEFPVTEAVARSARAAGDAVVMGSPNVVRGGSHLGWASAAGMAEAGLCDVLCSDYYYPAMLHAPFVLAGRGKLDLVAAWRLVSANPARALGLDDRGSIAHGMRADLVLVDPEVPRPVATIANGRLAWAAWDGAARIGVAPGAGLEPATQRLTAACSTD